MGSQKPLVKVPVLALATAFIAISTTIPFSSSVMAANCTPQTTTAASSNSTVLSTKYNQWKQRYVTVNGAGGDLRVQRSAGDNYDTVSEGIAYGMIFAAYMNDRTTFDKLWSYEQKHLDSKGLMHWRIDAGGYASGQNSASDSDEDMAIALMAADKQWGGDYAQKAKKQIQLMLTHNVEGGSNVWKPGDSWGGSDILNASYITPSYYKAFASYTVNNQWSDVARANDAVLNNIFNNTAAKRTGLVPDWSNANGYQTNGMGYNYGYDAIRHPIRMALDSQWYCASNSNKQLATFNSFFETKNINTVVDGYTISGSPIGGTNNAVAVGPIAAAAVASSNSSYRNAAWQKISTMDDNSYYADSIQMLSMLVATGKFINPLELTATTSTTPTPTTTNDPKTPVSSQPTSPSNPFQQAKIDIWWPTDGSKVTGNTPFKTMIPDSDVSQYDMYWQVDGGGLVLMGDDYRDYPHKQVDVDVSGWNWRSNNQYKLTFVAKTKSGQTISTKDSLITVVK